MQQFPQEKSAFGLEPNVAAGLAYLPVCMVHLVVSIVILAADKTNKFTRFNAIQSLLITASIIVGYIVMFVLMALFVVIGAAADTPALAFLGFLVYIIFILFVLAMFVGLIIAMIYAFQGKTLKLPVIGNLAEKWS